MASNNNSSNKEKLHLLLECASCNVDLVNDQPKSLSCLHTFCKSCLIGITGKKSIKDATTFCPVCNARVSSENLKLDVIIKKLLHARRLQLSGHLCEMCTNQKGVISTHWCRDCGKFLCDSCVFHHGHYKPNDKVIALSKGKDIEKVRNFISPTKCSRHKENLKAYCSQCKICLCLACSLEHVSDKNMKCETVSIEKVAPDIKSRERQILKKNSLLLEFEKQQIEGMKLKIDNLKTECSEKGAEIWDHVEETMRRLKENASTFIGEMECKTKIEIDDLEKLIKLKQDHIKEMEITVNNFQQLFQSFDDVDILLNYSRLEFRIKKPTNNYTPHVVNMKYNMWYLKTHKMSKSLPLGYCWKNLELIDGSSSDERLNSKEKSNMLQPFSLPPEPYLHYNGFREITFDSVNNTIFVPDKKHVLVSIGDPIEIQEYRNVNLKLIKLKHLKCISDFCNFSSDTICIVDGDLRLMEMKEGQPLKMIKLIKPLIKYYSVCNCFGKVLVCDYCCRVHLLKKDGTVQRTVTQRPSNTPGCGPYNLIRRGPIEETFLLHTEDKLFCYGLDGKCLFSVNIGKINDLRTDKYGYIYVFDEKSIYVLSPDTSEKRYLYFHACRSHRFRLCVEDDAIYFLTDFRLKKFNLDYHAK